MGRDLATLLAEGALFAVAGWAVSGPLAACRDRRAVLRLLPLALAGPFAMLAAGYGAYRLYLEFGLGEGSLVAAGLAVGLDALGLAAGGMLLVAALPRRRDDDGGGGPGPGDDLPPPPDPGGPDGWAEFERRFAEHVAAVEARKRHVLVR